MSWPSCVGSARAKVLAAEERHQLWMSGEVLVDEIEQLQQSLDRVDLVNLIDLEAQLLEAQLPDRVLEHGDVETALVPEVVIDHARVRARALADALDPRAAVTVGRELADGGAEDLFSGSVCVPLSAVHRGKNTSQTTKWRKALATAVSVLQAWTDLSSALSWQAVRSLSTISGAHFASRSRPGRVCNAEVSCEPI